jgi:hypothetical protein
MLSPEEMKKKSLEFLSELYKMSGGNQTREYSKYKIGENLELDYEVIDVITQYLIQERLAHFSYGTSQSTRTIGITQEGINELQKAKDEPNMQTDRFRNNIINIFGNAVNTSVQQAGNNSSQEIKQEIISNKNGQLESIVDEIKKAIEQLPLQSQRITDLEAEIGTIEAQLSSSKPKKSIITESLSSIKTILESVAQVSTAAAPIIANISMWLQGHSH